MAGEDWRKLLDGKPPTSTQVEKIHEKSDKDGGPKSQHHTLGPGANQAAPGNHTHDGGASAKLDKLLEGVTITGSRGGNAALASVIAALVSIGATDSTSP